MVAVSVIQEESSVEVEVTPEDLTSNANSPHQQNMPPAADNEVGTPPVDGGTLPPTPLEPQTQESQKSKEEKPKDKVVFPPPVSWYKSGVAAARHEMWAYCSAGAIILVYPPTTYPKANGEPSSSLEADNPNEAAGLDVDHPTKKQSSPGANQRRWPKFSLMGPQLEKYNALSFCQSSWEYLPVTGAPLVSGCERGVVRVWNLEQKAPVIYHDSHVGNQVVGVDWSTSNHSIIYAIDDKGSMSVWNVNKNSLRSMNFGKILPTCLKASPYETNVVCFGTKGGNVFVVDVTEATGKILAKVRHDEEVVATLWMPPGGDWETLQYASSDSRSKLPLLVSTTHSMKIPTLRLWNKFGYDVGMLQSWEKDKMRSFKIFATAAWITDPNSGKLMLVSTGRKGEIVSWATGMVHDIIHNVHTHNAIFSIIQCGDIMWSLSYEPVIVGWNLRTMEVECVIPTFKGTSTIAPSPVDSCRLAIGGNDSVIRVLKFPAGYPTEGLGCTESPHITNKLKGKVTAIAWHPTRDNYIGFGTDEGVLGIFELREGQKYPMTFERRVNGTVYTVMFGPSVYSEGYVRPTSERDSSSSGIECEKEFLMLYACGGNSAFMVSPSRSTNPLINVNKIIEKANPLSTDNDIVKGTDRATEIRWAPDYSFLAVGYTDGRIELYVPPHLKMRCWIKCHLRAIQFLTWRPFDFCKEQSSSIRWLASASNDGTTRLYNLTSLFETGEGSPEQSEEPLTIISSEATLQGHGVRVISCAWSPHDKNLLVTVAYDCTAIVWNVEDGSHVARYMGHESRLVSCCFHPNDPFKVITVSDELSSDFTIHVWDYREHPFRRSAPKTPGCKPVQAIKAANETMTRLVSESKVAVSSSGSADVFEIKELGGSKIHAVKASSGDHQRHKPPKPKQLFPLTSNELINSKCAITKELECIIDKKPLETSETDVYLGVLGNSKDCLKLMQVERQGHASKKQLDNSAVLSVWMGDVKWIEQAIKNRQVTESMLHIAAFFSNDLYVEAMAVFAQQLIDNEEFLRASTMYFVIGDFDKAVKVLIDKALYREALVFLKTNFSPDDPRLVEAATKWAQRAITDGNFELACKIFCSIQQFGNALSVIEKRALPYAFTAGCYISKKLGDEKKLEMFGVKFVLEGIIRKAYSECFDLITEYQTLKWLTSIVKIHECVTGYAKYVAEIKKTSDLDMWKMILVNLLDDIRNYMALIDGDELSMYERKINLNILCSLAQNEADAQQIIVKNLTLLMIGQRDTEMALSRATEIIKLATVWLETKNVPLFCAVVMTTRCIVTEFKYSAEEEVPEKIATAFAKSLKIIESLLLKGESTVAAEENSEKKIIENGSTLA